MLGSLSGLNETDAMGRGMALGFGAIFGVALWLVLAVLLLIAAINGAMPAVGKIGAALALPLSAIAASVAIGLYGDRRRLGLRRAAPVAATHHGLCAVGADAVAADEPAAAADDGDRGRPGDRPHAGVVPGVARGTVPIRPNPRQQAVEQAREEKLRQEEQIALQREAEVFARLGPDSSLRDYLQYLPGGDSRSHEAWPAPAWSRAGRTTPSSC